MQDTTAVVHFSLHLAKSHNKILHLGNCHIISTTKVKVKCAEYMKAEGFNRYLINLFEKEANLNCKHKQQTLNFNLYYL